jgi:hypothetical protein
VCDLEEKKERQIIPKIVDTTFLRQHPRAAQLRPSLIFLIFNDDLPTNKKLAVFRLF